MDIKGKDFLKIISFSYNSQHQHDLELTFLRFFKFQGSLLFICQSNPD